MKYDPPPPVLDSARLIAYAFVEDVPFRRHGALLVDGELLEHVPRLAICVNLGADESVMLFHCDRDWNVLGVSEALTVAETKAMAEENYPGVASRWVAVEVSVETALAYYDAKTNGLVCSFCGRRPFELKGWVEGTAAVICRGCVEHYHEEFNAGPQESS